MKTKEKKTIEIDCNNNQSILRKMKCERGNADVDSIVYFVFYDHEYCQRIKKYFNLREKRNGANERSMAFQMHFGELKWKTRKAKEKGKKTSFDQFHKYCMFFFLETIEFS